MQARQSQVSPRKRSWGFFKSANLIPIILLSIVVVVLVWFWANIQNPNRYPIQHVKIKTNGHYISSYSLQKNVLTHLQGGFFSLNVDELRQGLLENPWVEGVSVRRIWPDSLLVEVSEAQPPARWNGNGVISVKGNILYPPANSIPTGLSEVDAPDEIKDSVLPLFTKFNEELALVNLRLARLQVTKREAWTAWLDNGVQISVCRDDVDKRFNDFVKLYPRIIGARAQDVTSVNLCYPNGLAINWKKDSD